MAKKSQFEIGREYQTRGDWKAKIISMSSNVDRMYAIHRPGEKQESGPILHDSLTGEAMDEFAYHPPPSYGLHPADIIYPSVRDERDENKKDRVPLLNPVPSCPTRKKGKV